jgi:ribulose-phosphate 3-epimerase
VSLRIAPSILSADFTHLADDIRTVEEAGADSIHVDVMDGHFVPNITIGPPVVKSIRGATRLPLDVHLMISDPDRYIPAFVDAGADNLTVHVETVHHLDRTIDLVRASGIRVGVALNPATPLASVEHVLGLVDLVLVMTVNPGFGGQKFVPYTLGKIRRVREMIREAGSRAVVQVDGGINLETMGEVVSAGAQVLVSGSGIFGAPDPAARIKEMLAMDP